MSESNNPLDREQCRKCCKIFLSYVCHYDKTHDQLFGCNFCRTILLEEIDRLRKIELEYMFLLKSIAEKP